MCECVNVCVAISHVGKGRPHEETHRLWRLSRAPRRQEDEEPEDSGCKARRTLLQGLYGASCFEGAAVPDPIGHTRLCSLCAQQGVEGRPCG